MERVTSGKEWDHRLNTIAPQSQSLLDRLIARPEIFVPVEERFRRLRDDHRLFGNYQLANSLDGKRRISTEMSATGSLSVFTVERRSICCHPGP
jgi:hypothetical protein